MREKGKNYWESDSKVFNDAVIRYELVETIENSLVSYRFVFIGYFNKITGERIDLFVHTDNSKESGILRFFKGS